jgi:hypothetical protein
VVNGNSSLKLFNRNPAGTKSEIRTGEWYEACAVALTSPQVKSLLQYLIGWVPLHYSNFHDINLV